MIIDLAYALISTLIIESIILFILKYRDPKIYVLELIINIITNLSLNYFLLTHFSETNLVYVITVILLEVVIVFIEGFFYVIYFKKIKEALKLSFILNTCSFLIGLLISLINLIIFR